MYCYSGLEYETFNTSIKPNLLRLGLDLDLEKIREKLSGYHLLLLSSILEQDQFSTYEGSTINQDCFNELLECMSRLMCYDDEETSPIYALIVIAKAKLINENTLAIFDKDPDVFLNKIRERVGLVNEIITVPEPTNYREQVENALCELQITSRLGI